MNKFIRSAYEMAMDEHANGAGMGFSADGLSLELRDLDVLSTRLRKYFNHNKVSSFCRQLNNYGFKKLVPTRSAKSVMDGKRLAMTTGEEVPSLQVFVHPCFQRNRPDLCCQIRRQASGPRRPRPTNAAAAATATTASASDDEEDEDEDEDAATSSANTSNNSATIDHLLELNANLRKHNIDLLQQIQVLHEDALLRKCPTCLGTTTTITNNAMRRSSGEEAQLMFGCSPNSSPSTATAAATANLVVSARTALSPPIIGPNNPFDS